jgi:L-malate glycosyltransferase
VSTDDLPGLRSGAAASFAGRQWERVCYLYMLVALRFGALLAHAARIVFPLIRWRKAATVDLALFPYYPPDYPGYSARFGNYLPLMERDGISCRIFSAASAEEVFDLRGLPRRDQYLFYARVYWRRLAQLAIAPQFRVALVQRGAFPYYPDQTTNELEALLRTLVKSTVIDFYDADYVHNPTVVHSRLSYFDGVTVVCPYLAEHFAKFHSKVGCFPLCVRLEEYPEKQFYEAAAPPRLLWMGSVANAARLGLVLPALQRLAQEVAFRLVLVCAERVALPGVETEWIPWTNDVLHKVLPSCDVALYPAENSEVDRGKMALKVLEYMAIGLPTVASPYGLAESVVHGETALVADGPEAWLAALESILRDKPLRARMGKSARSAIVKYHSPAACYPQFRRLVLGE